MPTADRRSVLTAAFEEQEKAASEVEERVETSAADPGEQESAAPDASEEQADTAPASSDRDDKGRFKPKADAEATPDAAAEPEQQAAQEQTKPDAEGHAEPEKPAEEPAAASQLKAPSSWKPLERELFAKLPPEFRPLQAEIVRVNREVQRTMREASAVRDQLGSVIQTIAPFESLIRQTQAARGEQYNPLPIIGSLLQTASVLRVGTPDDKAAVIAKAINEHGIDLERINARLNGQPAPEGHAAGAQPPVDVERLVQQHFGRFVERAQQQRAQQAMQDAHSEMEDFGADPKNEFFEDVRGLMGQMMADAAENNEPMTMAEAYEMAVRASPKTRPLIEQRERAKAASAKKAQTQRARAASSSVRSTPSGATGGEQQPKTWRAAIEQAFEEHESRKD